MALLSTSSRLIKVGQDYSAGSGISIDNHTISVTGEFGRTYSAGDNIDIYEQDEQLYISSKDWTSDIANASANAYNEATAQIPDPFDPTFLSGEIDNKLNSTAFTTWQNGQYSTDLQTIEGQINNKLDTSSFSDVSGSFLTAHQSLDGYATENWVTAQGYLTGVSIPESATWQDVSETVQSNSAQWAEGGSGDEEVNELVHSNSATWNEVSSKLDESTFQEASGLFLTAIPQEYITETDIPNFISAKLDTTAFADVSGTFLTAHQSLEGYATENWVTGQGYLTAVNIPESATWNDVSTTVQSNSAQWADGGSTSGFVSGTNTLFVPYYPGASDGRVYSANISGDVAVSTGSYYNGGADINISRTYSLSSIGSQLENKLDSNVIGNSKTLSIISNTAEVYAIGYKPTEFVTTGITIRNYSNDHTFSFYISPNDYLYSANFVVESDGFDTNRIPSDWVFVNSANGSASFCKYYKDGVQSDNADYFDYQHTITNASAYVVAHKGRVIDALAFKSDLTGEAGDTEVNELVHTNSATWNTVTDKLDTTAQVITGYTTATIEGTNAINSLNGKPLISFRAASAQEAGVSNRARYDDDGNNLADDHNSLTALNSYVQTNSGTIDETVTAYQNNSATYLTAHQAISAEEWNNCYNNVNTNSGAWGGSALPISAGPGIKVNLVDNTLVFSNDETLLYSAAPKNYGGESSGESITLNESISSFERLRFYLNVMKGPNSPMYYESYEVDNYLGTACNFQYGPYPENNVTANWMILRAWATNNICNVSAAYNSYTAVQDPYWPNRWFPGSLYKIVGINRK